MDLNTPANQTARTDKAVVIINPEAQMAHTVFLFLSLSICLCVGSTGVIANES